jgi:hypothetical protein
MYPSWEYTLLWLFSALCSPLPFPPTPSYSTAFSMFYTCTDARYFNIQNKNFLIALVIITALAYLQQFQENFHSYHTVYRLTAIAGKYMRQMT